MAEYCHRPLQMERPYVLASGWLLFRIHWDCKPSQNNASSTEVIRHLKSRNPFSDNGPQFSAEVFAKFTKSYSITKTIASSQRYPQGNGEAERAVRTVQSIFKIRRPIFRLTGLSNYSHTQWIQPVATPHGMDTESTIPQLETHFAPQLPNQT